MKATLSCALKEWAVAVNALEQGKTILLLRKGGIREESGGFEVPNDTVLLYSTFEHQQRDLLKPEYASQVTPVESGWHPETIKIGSYARITDVLPVTNQGAIKKLESFHIWNEQFASDRLKWKPRQPVYLLLLRVYRLPEVQTIAYRPEYSGCKSWIDLAEPIAIANSTPSLSDSEYNQQANAIRQII